MDVGREGETRREGPAEPNRQNPQNPGDLPINCLWLEAVPGGQPTLLGDQVLGEPGPSHSHFLSLCQHLRPHSYSRTALGVLQKK